MNAIVASLLASVLYAVALSPALLLYLGRERSGAAAMIVLLVLAVVGSFLS